jgi:predicted site-specific integrase-resolvase
MSQQKDTQPKWMTLRQWAEQTFATPPHINTLHNWINDGRIHPPPKKIGRLWHLRPNAEYVAD